MRLLLPLATSSLLPIGPWALAGAAAFLLIVWGVAQGLDLGLGRAIWTAAARCYIQLLLLGFALSYIFLWDSPQLTMAWLGLMAVFTAWTVRSRLRRFPQRVFGPVLAAILVSGFAITFGVTVGVIGLTPWHDARYLLPIGGMVFGNSMNGIALTLERLFSDLDQRNDRVEAWLALGATPWEASRDAARSAIAAGLIPTINGMATVGIVWIPGIMTGQVLAGADPSDAARYQIVVMLMIAAATALGAALAVRFVIAASSSEAADAA